MFFFCMFIPKVLKNSWKKNFLSFLGLKKIMCALVFEFLSKPNLTV